jgi:cytochrome b561
MNFESLKGASPEPAEDVSRPSTPGRIPLPLPPPLRPPIQARWGSAVLPIPGTVLFRAKNRARLPERAPDLLPAAADFLPAVPDLLPTVPDLHPTAPDPVHAAALLAPGAIRRAHALTISLLMLSLSVVFYRDSISSVGERAWLLDLHRLAGVLILSSVVYRIVLRIRLRGQLPDHQLPAALRLAAHGAHLSAYAGLFGAALLGLLLSGAEGRPATLLGFIPFPAMVGRDRDLADDLSDYHHWMAYALIGLIVLHILAALWHHLLRRDAVLHSMFPHRPFKPLRPVKPVR